MYVHPYAYKVVDEENKEVVAYVTMVNSSWFAVSVIDKPPLYCFEVHDEAFAQYAWEYGIEIDMNKLPDNIYKCFSAAYLVIAECLAEKINEDDR